MSGEDNNTNNTPDMITAILEAINNSNNNMNTNINTMQEQFNEKFNSLTNEPNSNNQAISEKLESVQEKFETIQAENAATREELLARIDTRSRASTRALSRATSPRQLATRLKELNMKMPELIPDVRMPEQAKDMKVPELRIPMETPRTVYSEPRLTMTEIFKDKQTADDFAEQNKRKPAVNKRDNTISSRETFAAINRPGNPVMKGTPNNKARLSSPLTLEKCLTFERDMLEVQRGGSI